MTIDDFLKLLDKNKHLIDTPFTPLHQQGVRGVFGVSEIDEVLPFSTGLVT